MVVLAGTRAAVVRADWAARSPDTADQGALEGPAGRAAKVAMAITATLAASPPPARAAMAVRAAAVERVEMRPAWPPAGPALRGATVTAGLVASAEPAA